jgi:hypothetical protein
MSALIARSKAKNSVEAVRRPAGTEEYGLARDDVLATLDHVIE